MIDTQHLIRFIEELPLKHSYKHTEYWFEIIKRLRVYDKFTNCPETAIDTRALIAYIRKGNKSIYSPSEQYVCSEEIVARLRERDKLVVVKEGVEKLIATLSNEIDK